MGKEEPKKEDPKKEDPKKESALADDDFGAWKAKEDAAPIKYTFNWNAECQGNTQAIDAGLTMKDITELQQELSFLFEGLRQSVNVACTKKVVEAWKKFEGTKNIFKGAAPVEKKTDDKKKASAKIKVSGKVDAKTKVSGKVEAKPKVAAKVEAKPKAKLNVKVSAKGKTDDKKKRRRLQAPEAPKAEASATLKLGDKGIDLAAYKDTGLEVPKELAGDGQVDASSGRLLSTLFFAMIAMFLAIN